MKPVSTHQDTSTAAKFIDGNASQKSQTGIADELGETAEVNEMDRGILGDARPDNQKDDPRANGSLPQEDVDDRENVSTVKPEDYPLADRTISKPA